MVFCGTQERRPHGLALWRGSEVRTADPHDPPEGFIIFGSLYLIRQPPGRMRCRLLQGFMEIALSGLAY